MSWPPVRRVPPSATPAQQRSHRGVPRHGSGARGAPGRVPGEFALGIGPQDLKAGKNPWPMKSTVIGASG